MPKTKMIPVLLSILVLSSTLSAQTSERRLLLEPEARDLTPTELVAPSAGGFAAQATRVPVTFDRALSADEDIRIRAAAPESRSKEFWREVTASELQAGISIHAAAPGALVRINPVAAVGLDAASWGDRKAIEPERLIITGAAGQRYGEGQGMDLMVTSDQLQAAGSPFPEGTSAFRLKEALGAGSFQIRAVGLSRASDLRFVLHVLDQRSDLELTLGTLRANYLHGETMRVNVSLGREGQQGSLRIENLRAQVVSPSGKTFDLAFRHLDNGIYRGRLVVNASEAAGPGLWEVQAFATARVDGRIVERGSRTAFAAALPSARFTGEVELDLGDRTARGLSARFAVESAASGRYEVRGLLYGTDTEGRLRPLALADTATWLEAGTGHIELSFRAELFAASELTAPFEVRDLQLLDQGRMSLLQQQARALRVFE